jgi:NADH-quinone oxidoreductase subunit A
MLPWPLILHFVLTVLLVAAIIGASYLLGERRRDRRTDPYESGIEPTGSARRPLPIQFYPVGIAFLVFDLEVAVLVAWAVAARDGGWSGYLAIAVFAVILLIGLLYEWRLGVLDWGGFRTVGGRASERTKREPAARGGGAKP